MPRRTPDTTSNDRDQPQRVPALTIERRIATTRPMPPEECDEDRPETFVPAPTFAGWIRETFVLGSGPLSNEEHSHLDAATIGVLWTNGVNVSKMRHIAATAEMPNAMAGGWRRGRHDFQLREWFGIEPDFLLTFSAPACGRMTNREFCATVAHELHHCAQKEDPYGQPMFNRRDGSPIFTIRGHDVEEFIPVVRDFGPTSRPVRDMIRAAGQKPTWDGPAIDVACGTCLARAA